MTQQFHEGQEVEAFGYLPNLGLEIGWRKGTIIHPLTFLPDPDGKIWWIAFQEDITRIAFHVDNIREVSK